MAVRRRKGTVGVIGLGIMGGAFAKNLVKAGWHSYRLRHNRHAVVKPTRGVEIAQKRSNLRSPFPQS
jgi:3-hydroxyisobutyrate dehydrogenase-like beta-hydroxyacid dehydrogenase